METKTTYQLDNGTLRVELSTAALADWNAEDSDEGSERICGIVEHARTLAVKHDSRRVALHSTAGDLLVAWSVDEEGELF